MQYELNKQNIRAATALKPWVLVGARGCSWVLEAHCALPTVLLRRLGSLHNIIHSD